MEQGRSPDAGCVFSFKKGHLIVSIVNMGCIFYWTPFKFLEFSLTMKNREYYKNRNAYSELWKEVSTTTDEDAVAEDIQQENSPIPPEVPKAPAAEPPVGDPLKACPEVTQEDAISLSNKIVRILENKAKLHNARHESKVTTDQLKEVYTSGSEDYEEIDESVVDGWKSKLAIKCDWPVFSMARVNSFLRMKRGEKVNSSEKIDKVFASDQELDFTSSLLPSEESLVEANEDLVEINLEDMKLLPHDLYLETPKQAEALILKKFTV